MIKEKKNKTEIIPEILDSLLPDLKEYIENQCILEEVLKNIDENAYFEIEEEKIGVGIVLSSLKDQKENYDTVTLNEWLERETNNIKEEFDFRVTIENKNDILLLSFQVSDIKYTIPRKIILEKLSYILKEHEENFLEDPQEFLLNWREFYTTIRKLVCENIILITPVSYIVKVVKENFSEFRNAYLYK